MALLSRPDPFGRADESRLHRRRQRLRLRDGNEQLGELVVAADRLTGQGHKALVARRVELAALDCGLIVGPARVVARQMAELIQQSLNPAGFRDCRSEEDTSGLHCHWY